MPDQSSRRLSLGVLRRVRRRGPVAPQPAAPERRPVLSVVIPVYNVADYLRECLDSVLAQALENLEIIAVDDGSTDGCPEILAEYAAREPRLRVVTQANAGQGTARNRGIELARGEFLTFCDSDDTVPPRAYQVMVRTLRRSGSDFVVGAARRVKHGHKRAIAWGETVHAADRISTTIDEFPAALQDIIACNRVFRTTFWRDRVATFEEGVAYEDHLPMLAAYVRAERFDVLARVTYYWRMREDNTSTGQQKAELQNLLDRVAVKERAFDLLRAEASEATYDAWVGRCLDIDFPPFLPHALTGSDQYRDALAATYRTFLDRATDRALRTVRHDRAVRAWLCAAERWDELGAADEHFRGAPTPAVRLVGDRLFAVPDLPAGVGDDVPEELWALADSETVLRTGLRSVVVDGTTVRLSGQAIIPGLGTADRPGDLEAWLLDARSETVVPLAVTPRADAEVDAWAEDGNVSYLHSAFDAVVDVADLPADAATWTLRLRLRQGSVVREAGVHDAVEGSSAQLLADTVIDRGDGLVLVAPGWDPAAGFRLRVGPADAQPEATAPSPALGVHRLELEPGALLVEATATGLTDADLAAAVWQGPRLDLPASEVERVADSVRFRFPTTTTPAHGIETLAPSGRYTLVVQAPDGERLTATAAPPLAEQLPRSRAGSDLRVTEQMRRNGTLVATLGAPLDDEERRPDVRRRLQLAHQSRTTPRATPAVLFQTRAGTVGDSPAALDAALARLHPDLPRSWAVRDRSVRVPAGAEAVLVGSRAWYEALAAPMVWASGDLPDFFVNHPDQQTLQTFAGFPTRPVGRSMWEARGHSSRTVRLALARRRQQWDRLVAPSEAIAEVYRRDLEFDGPVLVTGYPRCDDLVTRDRDTVRTALLTRMGVPADHTVVLYAPERRDRATRALLRAHWPTDLDVGRLAAALGPDHVVLTLGAPRSEPAGPGAARVVDVTNGPPVNDVLLAADVAVLDYSALRFDWALTGRPTIFHVPDHDDHLAALPAPVDFDSTAAGLQVTDLDGVLDGLRDPDGVRDRFAPAVADLNRTYNALHDGHAGERVVRALLG